MARTDNRTIRFGIGIQGGGGHWRDPAIPDGAAADIRSYIKLAQLGEAAKFDFAFIADSAYITKDATWPFLSRLEPISALSAVAAVTERIGLVGTMTTSYSEPFTTARQLASLDKISNGRAGWNAVTSALEGVAKNYGHDKLHDHALRYRIAQEYVGVVNGLWDSWEDDAFVRNRETNQYVDFDKMHTLDHQGEFFSVQGPLNIERSPQGRPVQFQAGASEAGRDLAARYADAIFSDFASIGSGDLTEAQEQYQDIKRRVKAYGRNPEHVLILPSIGPIVGDTEEEAERLYQESLQYIDIDFAVKYLSRYFSFFDFSQFPLDEPLPDLGDIGKDSFRSTAEYYKRIAREEKLTLRQLALRAANPRGAFVGTAVQIADKLQALFEQPVVDGFIVFGNVNLTQRFVDKVIPILQERGLFRTEYEAETFRGNLGLDFPENRYAAARRLVDTERKQA
ncbi:LLM class flavin-dependent oxidoreductase [Pseudomonas sp. 13B_2.1_Bac1]|uniref:LLM class flavin-dependent oxidoreductase n=1 Tax=Pseudomonas sp. 13B_2.1_Bac1 TaxID=2971624 RepID=UPI0021CA7AB3|nr:LLM class flavin-dependent oxidoreductase [Pseudomonas sp. 13B_2.1_Bac1]MCU1785275.1 LLM class flavin-dependent oxidoreductase [Pseudomonas sp. 13B_2.1_Bac1]